MKINYIYNTAGKIEYAVIPYYIWNKVKGYTENLVKERTTPKKIKFNPSEFRGMLSHHNFDIELELKNMRDEWTRNF